MRNKQNDFTRRGVAALLAVLILAGANFAQTTAFTYQGKLTDGAAAANGVYDLGFALFDAESGGNQIGAAVTRPAINVSNGVFTVSLDFGANPFASGANRFLEIAVKRPADANFTTLAPRQQLTSSPYSIQSLSAKTADGLSANCASCVTNAQIASVDGAKVTGKVASAATANTATTAGNVSGVVAIANGGTGSATKNFVDTTTNQTVGGNKTFSGIVTGDTLSAGGGGLYMNDRILRLRGSGDDNHAVFYAPAVDGLEFRGFRGFRWMNGTNGATQRMALDAAGNLTVGGNITTTGTFSGTLADNSVGGAQVADGSLRLSDMAIFSTAFNIGGAIIGAHACASFTVPGLTGTVANDIVYFIPPVTSPAGFSFQPVYLTGSGAFSFPFCNTLNTNNTLPAQSYRVFVMRP